MPRSGEKKEKKSSRKSSGKDLDLGQGSRSKRDKSSSVKFSDEPVRSSDRQQDRERDRMKPRTPPPEPEDTDASTQEALSHLLDVLTRSPGAPPLPADDSDSDDLGNHRAPLQRSSSSKRVINTGHPERDRVEEVYLSREQAIKEDLNDIVASLDYLPNLAKHKKDPAEAKVFKAAKLKEDESPLPLPRGKSFTRGDSFTGVSPTSATTMPVTRRAGEIARQAYEAFCAELVNHIRDILGFANDTDRLVSVPERQVFSARLASCKNLVDAHDDLFTGRTKVTILTHSSGLQLHGNALLSSTRPLNPDQAKLEGQNLVNSVRQLLSAAKENQPPT